jgi:hypothetical protein
MSVSTESSKSAVRDSRPPDVVVRVANLVLRPLLRTPAARLIKPLALLEFHGRRSGQRRRIVVAWHVIDGVGFAVTPAQWRTNFIGGHPATVYRRGRSMVLVGTLEPDPAVVAVAINRLLGDDTSARSLALHVPVGHMLDADDIGATDRALVRFEAVLSHAVPDGSVGQPTTSSPPPAS